VASDQERAREVPVNRAPGGKTDGAARARDAEAGSAEQQGNGFQGGVPEAMPRGGPDPRFANYFVTGSLQSIQPLRQERRVQRNKALVMLFLAIVLLYGVFSLIF
jgi:hypothetical protein